MFRLLATFAAAMFTVAAASTNCLAQPLDSSPFVDPPFEIDEVQNPLKWRLITFRNTGQIPIVSVARPSAYYFPESQLEQLRQRLPIEPGERVLLSFDRDQHHGLLPEGLCVTWGTPVGNSRTTDYLPMAVDSFVWRLPADRGHQFVDLSYEFSTGSHIDVRTRSSPPNRPRSRTSRTYSRVMSVNNPSEYITEFNYVHLDFHGRRGTFDLYFIPAWGYAIRRVEGTFTTGQLDPLTLTRSLYLTSSYGDWEFVLDDWDNEIWGHLPLPGGDVRTIFYKQ